MNYLSVCSGIEAASVAWLPLGFRPIGFSEIEKFPCSVLSHHYPQVPNFGDMTKHEDWPIKPGTVDIMVGGTPCQSFSVAGLRKGLADPRGNLALVYLGMVNRFRPQWVVWENVPGVLSSNGGNDFASFIGALRECGYSCAWRILDAQYWGVAQRRRRLFVVGHSSDWRRPAAVLFEPESSGRGYPPSCEQAQETTSRINGSTYFDGIKPKGVMENNKPKVLATRFVLDSRGSVTCERANCLVAAGNIATLCVSSGQSNASDLIDQAPTATRNNDRLRLIQGSYIRRLTPLEYERLQGFPDDYTKISNNTADAPRYKAIGNSMAVPVVRWLGQRIKMV